MGNRNFWAVGSSFGGEKDMTSEFKANGEWYDGRAEDGDDKYRSLLEEVKEGDVFVMKSSSTKGPGRTTSFTKVKGVGIVQKKHDYYHFSVQWLDVPNLPLDFDNLWYSQTIQPLREDEILQFIKPFIGKVETMELLSLLTYKKQIILQGPPGTGKTKLAKELAEALVGKKGSLETAASASIDKATIQRLLKDAGSIKTKSGKDLMIVALNDRSVDVKTSDSETWSPSYNKIIESFNNRLFENPSRTGGFVPYEDAIAKYLSEHHFDTTERPLSEFIKLVQFHPSYSYDDFVQGITVKPNDEGEGVLYEAENKILAKFAKEATDNYKLSKSALDTASKVMQTKSDFDRFVEYVQDFLADSPDQKFPLTNDVYIFSSDAARFKYKGDNWVAHSKGLNMKYSELEKIIQAGVTERAQVKNVVDMQELSRQHATYFFNTVRKFREFVEANPAKTGIAPVEEKSFVLIIDEINRANLPSVLGELIYALEYRGEAVAALYEVEGSNKLELPPNLYIIGTMNTADRSVGHIDYAIRRRFAFVDVKPEDLTPTLGNKFHKPLFDAVAALFDKHLSQEFKKDDVQLGHSYFIDKSDEGGPMSIRLQYEILPLLTEYIKDGVLKESDDLKKEIAALANLVA